MGSTDAQGFTSESLVIAETSPGQPASSQLATSPTRSVANNKPAVPVASTSTSTYASRPAPTRTYGKKKVAGEAPVPADPVILPETDPEPASEPPVRGLSMRPSGSSSPPRQTQHSTDPTSEEDQGPSKSDKPDRELPSALNGRLSEDGSGSSDDDGAEAEDDIFEFLKAGRDIAARLKDIDNDDLSTDAALKSDSRPASKDLPAADNGESSSLPTLTPSEDQGSESRTQAVVDDIEALLQDEPAPASEPTSPVPGPSRVSRSGKTGRKMRIVDSEDEYDDDEKEEGSRDLPQQLPTPAPTAAPSKKDKLKALAERKQREHEEKERARRGKSASVAPPAREQEEEAPADDEMDEVDRIMNEDSGGKKKKNGMFHRSKGGGKGSKPKRLSKKQEDEMNQTSAKLAREKDIRLAPTRKGTKSVFEVLKQQGSALPPAETRPIGRASLGVPVLNLASDPSSIENSSPGPAPATPKPTYSLNALGQQRPAGAPDHIVDETPLPRRAREASAACLVDDWRLKRDREPKKASPDQKVVAAPITATVATDDVDDDELGDLSMLDFDAEVRKAEELERKAAEAKRREEKAKQLLERKLQAAAAARNADKVRIPDSDSDLEIEGRPKLKSATPRSRRHRTPQEYEDTLAAYADDKASRKKDNPALRLLQKYGRIDPAHPPSEENDPSDSQFEAAGKRFGAHLDPRMSYAPDSVSKRRTDQTHKATGPPATTVEGMNMHLTRLAREQAVEVRKKKESKARREANEHVQAPSELASVNVDALVKEKQSREEEDEKMEEDADGDYVDSDAEPYDSGDLGSDDAESGDEAGSASETAADSDTLTPAAKRREPSEVGDDALDSEGEMILPRSSQNEDRLGKALDGADLDEDDAGDSSMPPQRTARTGRKLRIADDDDEETAEPAAAPVTAIAKTPAPARVALGGLMADLGGDDGGFSQFFDSQFSQGGDDAGIADGFRRGDEAGFAAPAPTMFALQPLIGTAERDADAERLENRGGFNDFELTTPREIAAPRQYINDKGLLTQTRPAAQYDSPSDTPSRSYRQSLSDRDSQSQAFEATQLASAQTPTQAPRHPNALRRTSALVHFDSVPELAPTELAGTRSSEMQLDKTQVDNASDEAQLVAIDEETQQDAQLVPSTDEMQEETQDVRPSAAQPIVVSPRNAFDVLRAGRATTPPRPAKRRGPNEFIAAEADLSDEEQAGFGLGGVSGDENEDDDDRELDELVDNTKEDADVEAEQDEKARELRAEQEAKKEAEELARAQRIAAGKERKRGRNELEDDDFDDDYVRGGRGEKRERVDQGSVADLLKNEETQRFGETLGKACVPESLDSQWLCQAPLAGDDDDDDDVPTAAAEDVFGPRESRPAVNAHDVRKQAADMQRARDSARRAASDSEPDEDVLSSAGSPSRSPRIRVEIRKKKAEVAVAPPAKGASHSFAGLESNSLMFSNKSAIVYGGAGGEDSQTASFAGNSRGTITGFKKSAAGATKLGGTAPTKAKSNALAPQRSKLSGMRRRDFS